MFCTWDKIDEKNRCLMIDVLVEKIDVMFSACVEAQGFPAHA